ncbi:hypothetical protein HETIRDRAFT_148361 [Heterobasidion irregulare TC 32-1]|uniref:DUF6534 domain-containing protein n=1 Tax=Heterobasidion irregulare (strain TC 32-1) TaxID=747525 RepID=W4JRU6_HETIT|nr:uncharacterized protein HETIRDRAFT_148361 [Heterobasidion irregulare TC 32-1]ETW76194.1 hypothetical protein HETIRDRAFT_148361 [Heterobasidion irregulare TC 32-1]
MAATNDGSGMGATYGSLLIGTILSGIFYGITSLQSIHYFNGYADRDQWKMKTLVSVLLLIDTIVMVLHFHAAYHYFVVAFGDASALEGQIMTWSFQLESVFTGVVTFLCQMFFVIRIRKLHRGLYPDSTFAPWLFSSLTLLAVVAFVTSLVLSIILFLNPLWLTLETERLQELMIANIVFATVLDVFITIALCVILERHRSGFKSTDSLINGLMRFMITRGIITTVIQGATLVTYLALPSTFIWLIFHLSTSKIYANAVLTTLTSRTPPRVVNNKDTEIPGDTWNERDPNACVTSTTISFQAQPDMLSCTTVALEDSRIRA